MRLMWKPRGYSPVASPPRGRGSRCRRAAAPMALSTPRPALRRPSSEYFAQRAGISCERLLILAAAAP